MNIVTKQDVQRIKIPHHLSHKGQNGRLLLIGGSELFHAAILWSLTVASRIVDLVHFASVEENNSIVKLAKAEFRNGIVISRRDLDSYIEEDDCILIGPGMTRDSDTKNLTDRLLEQYPRKQWVIDAGALQMMDISLIPVGSILTPHHGEFRTLCEKSQLPNLCDESTPIDQKITRFAKDHQCYVLLKGETDIIGTPNGDVYETHGGNAGMTKGGTGDVLSGLIAALVCTNEPLQSTIAGSFINKSAADDLYKTVGPFFNASDLTNQIPKTMKSLLAASL